MPSCDCLLGPGVADATDGREAPAKKLGTPVNCPPVMVWSIWVVEEHAGDRETRWGQKSTLVAVIVKYARPRDWQFYVTGRAIKR